MEQKTRKVGVIKSSCSRCGKPKESNRLKYSYCKDCHAFMVRATRRKYCDLSPVEKLKANARSYAKIYLKRGKIQKKNCAVCDSPDAQMHHPDYNKPLEVVFLCRAHHDQLHHEVEPSQIIQPNGFSPSELVSRTAKRRELREQIIDAANSLNLELPSAALNKIIKEEFTKRGF